MQNINRMTVRHRLLLACCVFHRLASEGVLILAPMYRQSDGGEGKDELGGADLNDLVNVLPLAKSLGFVDVNNLFILRECYPTPTV